MKYINSLAFRCLILFILAILVPTILLGSLNAIYFKDKLIEEIDNANSQTASLLIYNLDNYMSELERLSLSPYTNMELLRAIREMNKNIKADTVSSNYVIFNELDYIVPRSFMYVDSQTKGMSISITEKLFIACEKYGAVKTYEVDNQEHSKWYNAILGSKANVQYYGVHEIDYYSSGEDAVFSVVRLLKDYNTNRVLVLTDLKELTGMYIFFPL